MIPVDPFKEGTVHREGLNRWIGRTQTVTDRVTDRLLNQFRATLGPWLDVRRAEESPLGLHWCLGTPNTGTLDLGVDGHPPKRDFMPPVPLPRRMWAGGRI